MTIGIATRGPRAGAAALRILQAVEALGSGAIGGFAVFHGRDAGGRLLSAVTQDLGSLTLDLPPGWEACHHAALISSGPNRPEPLLQFVPGRAEAGLVTGHRLPTSLLLGGEVLNLAALSALQAGTLTQSALEALLASGPAMDAGLICLPLSGPLLLANAPRVETRDDTGRFLHDAGDLACGILHNSIQTTRLQGNLLAEAVGAMGLEVMGGPPAGYGWAVLPDQLPVQPAAFDAVELNAAGEVIALHSADPAYFSTRPRITAVYQSVAVHQGGRRIGRALSEVFAALRPGLLIAGPQRGFVWHRAP